MYIERIEQLEKGRRRLVFETGERLVLYKGEIRSYDPVSYTHLDVYKRQDRDRSKRNGISAGTGRGLHFFEKPA